jgi:uncharacterized membrane protein YbhN (UPF0104 family)
MKRWPRTILQVLSLAVFGLILCWAGPAAWRQVLTGDVRHVLMAFFFLCSASALSAARLQTVSRSLAGRRLASWHRFYHLNTTARAIGLVIPRSLTTLAGKPVALRSLGLSLKRSVWVVFVDSLFDLALLGILAVPALLFLGAQTSAAAALGLAVGLVSALAVSVWRATGDGTLLRVVRWTRRVPYVESIMPSTFGEAADLVPGRPTAMRALALTLLINATLVACYHHMGQAVGLSCPWILVAAGFPAVQLSLVVAVTPGGLGFFDAGWYGVLLLGGMTKQDALAFVVAQRAYLTVFVLACAGLGTLLALVREDSGDG